MNRSGVNSSLRGWLISAIGLGLVAVGIAFLLPDWRVQLGFERPAEPAGEARPVREADAGAGSTAVAPAAAGRGTQATQESASDTAAAPGAATTTTSEAESQPAAEPVATAAVPEAAADAAAPGAGGADEQVPPTARASGSDAAAVPAGDAAAEAAVADETAPVFDVVRVDPEGEAVIAGTAQPGAEVELLIDGVVIASAIAGGDGSFVVLASLGRSDRARALQLRAAGADSASAVHEEAVELVTAAPEAASDGAPADGVNTDGAETDGDKTDGAKTDGAKTEVATTADAGTAEQGGPAGSAEPARAGLSAPVVILPSETGNDAPLVVAPESENVALLQPAATETAHIVLDRISYSQGGDAVAAGRARPGHAVRAYANAVFVTDAAVSAAGDWQLTLPRAVIEAAKLLRFDEVTASGEVTSRLETPFAYDNGSGPVATRQRRIVVQRGDNLWRIAEQHYGEGIRYSVIFSANSGLIRDPDLIYPGQVFSIPELIAAE